MNNYIVLTKLRHRNNSRKGNKEIYCQEIKAKSLGHAELKIIRKWAALNCDATIIQITIYN
jgi:hypothetical protein